MSQKVILTRLLDKYEKSKHLYEPGSSNRRVMLRADKKDFPEYNYEDAEIRDQINLAAKSLEKTGYIQIEWVKNRPVIATIILNLEKVADCYRLIGRTHPKDHAQSVVRMVSERLNTIATGWIRAWRDDICSEAEQTYKVPSYCKEDLSILENLLSAFQAYDTLHGESITMRAFSSRVYHNTKIFEHDIRDFFLKIALKYNPELFECYTQENLGPREQLAFLGIYARPELYEISGNCAIETKCGTVDFSASIPYGMGIPSTLVDSISRIDLSQIKRITFIENKTNYDEYILSELGQDELAIYHGGFMSPQKRKFFIKLANSIENNSHVSFWADIDLGGFQMFSQLQQIIPQVCPMRMSEDDVREHYKNGLSRPDDYFDRLLYLLQNDSFPLFSGVIQLLIQYRVTIEQEAFLL